MKNTHNSEKPFEKYTAAFYTLGCRVNQYETRAIEEAFAADGFEILPFEQKCDVYVINTCTVTAQSDRKSRQIIRRAVKTGGENAVVIVTGCMSQTNPTDTAKICGVDAVCGNGDKLMCARLAKQLIAKKRETNSQGIKEKSDTLSEHTALNLVADISAFGEIEHMSVHGSDNTRAFLKIVDGCDNKCSYCIIPKARGHVRSKDLDEIEAECKSITDAGCREIVFTGIETAAFGKDAGITLADLAERVSHIENLKRIRFGSLEPTVITEDFARRLSSIDKVMPHFHLSLQSGSDRILAKMRRKYNTRMFLEKLQLLRRYFENVEITTDIIVGFPGETEEMFQETLCFAEKCKFLYIHIFPYSDRAGTEASEMPDKLSDKTKRQRAARLDEVMRKTRTSVLEKYKGCHAKVLWETKAYGMYHGYTQNYIEVKIPEANAPKLLPNDISDVILGSVCENAEYLDAQYQK